MTAENQKPPTLTISSLEDIEDTEKDRSQIHLQTSEINIFSLHPGSMFYGEVFSEMVSLTHLMFSQHGYYRLTHPVDGFKVDVV